jgi:WD40 repeat protein
MMDSDGTNQLKVLPESDLWQRQPAWSPDGRTLAFVADEQNSGRPLWMLRGDATDAKRLAAYADPFGAASSDPAWSTDGKRVAFIDVGAVVTALADGSDRVVVRQQTKPVEPAPGASPPPGDAYHAPAWMPDGRIAVIRHDAGQEGPPSDAIPEGPGSLQAMNADGSAYQGILGLELNTLDVRTAVWSPDGKRILLGAEAPTGGAQVWVINSDGTGLRQLTKDGASISPTWSPDGSSITFASDRDGHFEIYRMGSDGSDQARLTTSSESVANCGPSWGDPDPAIRTPLPTPSAQPGASPALLTYHRGRLDAGTYIDDTFQPTFKMTLPSGWEGRRNYVDGVAFGAGGMPGSEFDIGKVQTVFPNGCVRDEPIPIGRAPVDLINWLRSLKLLKTSALHPVNLAGYSGLQVDVLAIATRECVGAPRVWLFEVGQDVVWLRKNDEITIVVIDVRGTPVTMLYGGPAAEGFKPLGKQVLDTIEFMP